MCLAGYFILRRKYIIKKSYRKRRLLEITKKIVGFRASLNFKRSRSFKKISQKKKTVKNDKKLKVFERN